LSDDLTGVEARRGELPPVAGRGRCYQCEVERAWHGGELRQQSWCAVTVCFDLETIAMWWRRSAAVQWRKVDDAVEEMASAV
jgi:hypothetical protein